MLIMHQTLQDIISHDNLLIADSQMNNPYREENVAIRECWHKEAAAGPVPRILFQSSAFAQWISSLKRVLSKEIRLYTFQGEQGQNDGDQGRGEHGINEVCYSWSPGIVLQEGDLLEILDR